LGHLVADGVLCINTAQLLSGVLNGVDRCLERSYHRHVAHAASRHISPWPLRATTMFPPAARLVMERVSCTPLRLCEHLTGPPTCQVLNMWASRPQWSLGGEVNRWRWSYPCRGWHLVRPLSSGVGLNWARSRIRAAPAGALCQLHGGDSTNCDIPPLNKAG
jgi:hypothetical protein